MPAQEQLTDLQLAVLVSQQDEQAYALLFQRYWRRIYAVAFDLLKCGHLAEEVVQEVFLKVWMNRSELPSVKSFEHWLFIIARNHIYNTLRKKITERKYVSGLFDLIEQQQSGPEEMLQIKERTRILDDMIRRLPPQQQLVLRMAHQSGMDYASIGAEMGISRNTVRNHLARAVQSLRFQFRRDTRDE